MARKEPLRQCVICRQHFPKRELIRIVRLPEGGGKIDPTGKANGRGAYVCRKEACLKAAAKDGRLGKMLKTQLPDDLYEELLTYVKE